MKDMIARYIQLAGADIRDIWKNFRRGGIAIFLAATVVTAIIAVFIP